MRHAVAAALSSVVMAQASHAQPSIDIAGARIVAAGDPIAATLLRERLAERVAIDRGGAMIVVAPAGAVAGALPPGLRPAWRRSRPARLAPEAFAIRRLGRATLVITARGTRGLIYGDGWLLRRVAVRNGHAWLRFHRPIDEAPARPQRLTQIGYRPMNNSYDAWTLPMFRRRIEDFALWGASGIQVIAPVSDDAAVSPLFPAPPIDTLAGIGRITHALGLDFALYYPLLADYHQAGATEAEAARFAVLTRALPRIDALYIPGGDPGDTAPDRLFPIAARLTNSLHGSNPRAKVWLSAQGFDRRRLEQFYQLLARRPAWLTGIFVGPQSRDSILIQRARVPTQFQLMMYPDIGHTMHAQFPVPEWHPAFALTEGREPIDPRPRAMAHIFARLARASIGFVTYSEGINDDFNQALWFRLGWNPRTSPRICADEYARMFIGDGRAARLPAALEANWIGDPAQTAAIDATLSLAESIRPAPWADWRIKTLLYRAVYDALVRQRLIAARRREDEALAAVQAGRPRDAANILARPDGDAVAGLRQRLFVLAAELFAAARLQLSVKLYGASSIERGANLDRVDVDLNDKAWLRSRLGAAPAPLVTDHARAGEGALYDDLGDPAQEPHLVRGTGFAADPQLYNTAIDGIADRTPNDGWRLSEITYAESLYDRPLRLHYAGLDRRRHYRLVINYAGEDYAVPVRLVANGRYELHPPLARRGNPMTVEVSIPSEATARGRLDLAWTRPPGMGGSGRGHQVAETWLIPDTAAGDRR